MDMKQTGARIKNRREEMNISAAELAEKIGINKSTMHRYEAGNFKSLKLSTAEAIGRVLNVSTAWILGETDDPTPEKDAFLLNPSDEHDIFHIIEAVRQLLNQDYLMFDKEPADPEAVKTLSDGLTVLTETARLQNHRRVSNMSNWIMRTEKEGMA